MSDQPKYRHPKFRQPTPTMQLQAEISSLENEYLNWKESVTTTALFESRFELIINNIRELFSHVSVGKWPEFKDQSKPPIGGGHL